MTFQSPVPAKFSLLPVLFCKNKKYFQISQDKVQYGILIYFIIYYTFIELFFEFCHIFINFASKTIIKSYPLK